MTPEEKFNTENENPQTIIKPKSLELIAKEIGELDTYTNLIKFLIECGIDPNLIKYIQDEYSRQSKWQLIYAVLSELATSPNPKDQEILFKIIEEASHPLMHNGDEELAKKYEDKFNKLLKYDGFALRNYKLKRISKEAEQDNDLDLYLKKKILVENWRDDLSHPITELSFNNNMVEQICYSLWDLFTSDIIFFGANISPENILIETDPRFHKEIAFNWNLIRDLDNNPHKVEAGYGLDIEILNEKRLKQDIKDEVNEFISNKVEKEKIEKEKDFYPDTKFLETPSYLRGISTNYYAYKKQKEILLNFIANLYNKFENEILVIKFNEIEDKNVNVLRTVIALENEGFFTIKELRNDKKEWIDKDSVYTKIQLVGSKIPFIKKFLLATEKQKEVSNEIDNELSISKPAKEPISIKGEIKIEGLKEGLEAIVKKNEDAVITKNKKRIHLPHFPPTPWKDISIRFLDERNVLIRAGNKTSTVDYEGLGFSDDKSNKPNLAWVFLLGMAKNNGETKTIPSPVPDNIKQIKKQISDWLKKVFKNDTEPFYDFSETNTYKLKITLIPPQSENGNGGNNEDRFGSKEYLRETMASKYELPHNEEEW